MADRQVIARQLLPADGVGGVEIAAHAMERHHDPGLDFRLEFLTCERAATPLGRLRDRLFNFYPVAATRAALRVWLARCDVVIASLWRTAPAALLVKALRPRIRMVYFLHLDRTVHCLDRLVSRVAMAVADEVWADSQATLTARGVPSTKPVRIISFVIDRMPAGAPRPGTPSFAVWCRIAPQKGLDRAIRLIAALRERGHNATLNIWGPDGGSLAELSALARDLGVEASIRFGGAISRSDLPRVTAGHSFFLLPSRFEGMAMATVEAMQLGLVPVVTPVGEMANYCVNGVNAIVLNGEPSEEISSLEAVLENAERYRQISEAAKGTWRDRPLYSDTVLQGIFNKVKYVSAD